MSLIRRRTKMKLKIALIFVPTVVVLALVWYYVYTGKNPIVDIKDKMKGMYYKRATTDKADSTDHENSSRYNTRLSVSKLQHSSQWLNVGNKQATNEQENSHEGFSRQREYQKESIGAALKDTKEGSKLALTGKDENYDNHRKSDAREETFEMSGETRPNEAGSADQAPPSSITVLQGEDMTARQKAGQYQSELVNKNADKEAVLAKKPSSNLRPLISMMNILHLSNSITYNEGYLDVVRSTFFREARPRNSSAEKATVLLLHGMGLTSVIWINIGTFQVLVDTGYRALAIDLPGYGKSKDSEIPYTRDEILGYMTNLFTAFRLERPVVVIPSRSGEYAMPLLMAYPHLFGGVVAIAPTDTSKYLIKAYEKLSVPMLVLFGERDETMLHESSLDSLEHVPGRKMYMIKNSTHACYIDHPPTFHKLLLEFLQRVYS